VTLPYDELKSLWQAAQRETPEKRKAPVEATLLAARYQLFLKGDQANGVVEFETQSFTDEWTVVPLLGGQTQIDEVEPADVQLIAREGQFALVTNRIGKQKIRIKFAVTLTGSADGAHFRLATSPAAINTLSVAGIPEKQMLRIADATQLSAEKDRASYRWRAQEELAFDVIPEKAVVAPTPSRWKLEAQALVQFGDGKLNYLAHLAANTERGSGLTMELEFPAGADVTKISSPDLIDWQATTTENQTRRVHLHWQTRDVLRREVEVQYNFAQPLTGGEWNLRSPQLIDGENNPPLYVVLPPQGLDLTAAAQAAVPRQLPAWLLEKANGKNYQVFLGDTPVMAKWLPLVETDRGEHRRTAREANRSWRARDRVLDPERKGRDGGDVVLHREEARLQTDLRPGRRRASANRSARPLDRLGTAHPSRVRDRGFRRQRRVRAVRQDGRRLARSAVA
jgi:hypothetical protein